MFQYVRNIMHEPGAGMVLNDRVNKPTYKCLVKLERLFITATWQAQSTLDNCSRGRHVHTPTRLAYRVADDIYFDGEHRYLAKYKRSAEHTSAGREDTHLAATVY